MKKIKLNTARLQLKKTTIVGLTESDMAKILGGETGPCTTSPCEGGYSQMACPWTQQTNGCPSQTCEPAPETSACNTSFGPTCSIYPK
ncbi:class I lanthipeptide [Pedobacter cryoconitis]|uniref:Natural product n=1 Tax=Pedobacter cryoconitis TaxID=188932 RepID=A0A7X0J8F6_9SPHI|nr:hypothetical protein [Pedobacter cryoconitis]